MKEIEILIIEFAGVISLIISVVMTIVFFYMAKNLSVIRKILLRNLLKEEDVHRCSGCKIYFNSELRECPACKARNPEPWPIIEKKEVYKSDIIKES